MEHQTRFDLTAALQTWREELAAQPNLTAETRRELETHVNDTIAEMQQRGLNDEESFWLARRRVGQPKELCAEFAKADPTNTGREWVLWIALAFFAMSLLRTFPGYLLVAVIPRQFWGNSTFRIAALLNYLVITLFGVFVARSRSVRKFAAGRSLILTHGRIFVVCSFLAVKGVELAVAYLVHQDLGSVLLAPDTVIWPLTLVFIILWLLPAEKPPTLARA